MFLGKIRKLLNIFNENTCIVIFTAIQDQNVLHRHVIVMVCFKFSVTIYSTALKLLNVVILFELFF